MRTTGRTIVASALLGGAIFAGPVAAHATTTTVCEYPFKNCPTPTAPPPSETPTIGGGGGGPSTGDTSVGGGGTTTVVDNSPVRGSTGGAAGLPFTGGEVTLVALTGLAALGGGAVLVAAGRKRARA